MEYTFQNRMSWIESLSSEMNKQLENHNEIDSYSIRLPFKLNNITNSEKLPSYGNPINWIISGVSGMNAFIIGDIFNNNQEIEDLSEKNFYPPLLTSELNKLGEEYMYSQIAIVLLIEVSNENLHKWLNEWRDDPRYFRKIIIHISENETPLEIAKKITGTFLNPWNSIKSSELYEDSLEIFEKIEGDDQE